MRIMIGVFVGLAAWGHLYAGGEEQRVPNMQQVRGRALNMQQVRVMQNGKGQLGNAVFQNQARPQVKAFDGNLTAAQIRETIDNAVLYLKACQAPDGSIEEQIVHYSHGAGTAMATLAMLAAGADPASDESLQRALKWLEKNDAKNTYYRAVRANVWEYGLRKAPYDDYMRVALRRDSDWLMEGLRDKEGWRYLMTSTDWDNSVTQYGVLGIWAAARAGIEPKDTFWVRMSKHFRSCQNKDGGWGYQTGSSSANMATAGLATMFLVFDKFHGRDYYQCEKPSPFSTGPAADCLKSIERGMEWLGKNGGNNNDGYYLYGMERTGVASGRKYIGGHDWFAEGAKVVLGRQQSNGSIPMAGYGKTRINTAFGILFLVYGGAPVSFNKLEYGEGQDWNLNPRDIANVTKHMWSAYERPLNWHSVSITAPVEEFEAPILFISGSKAVEFSDKDVAKLRAYVDRGGMIFAEPSDTSAAFRKSMEGLVGRMYPVGDYPLQKPVPLPADHAIYSVLKQDWQERPMLHGVSDGSRMVFVLSDGYLSADWQMNKTDSDAFKLAMNLLFYATDLGELPGKFASILPQTAPAATRDVAAAKVAVARHGADSESPMDWAAGRECWPRMAPYFKHVTGGTVDAVVDVEITTSALTGIQLLCITGRRSFELSKEERTALKRYVSEGGTILVNAYAGSPRFGEQARKAMTECFGKPVALGAAHDLTIGRFAGGLDLSRHIRLSLPARRLLRERGEQAKGQKLEAFIVNKRPAVIFSEFDLLGSAAGIANYGALGYKPDSARKIVSNVIGWACGEVVD